MVTLWSLAFKGGPDGASEHHLYLALCEHADEKGFCYPNLERLAKRVRRDERSVRRSLAKLSRWVTIRRRQQGQNFYLDLPLLCLRVLLSGEKLTGKEPTFIADILSTLSADEFDSTVDKLSSMGACKADILSSLEAFKVDISCSSKWTFEASKVDISVPYIENRQEPSLEPETECAGASVLFEDSEPKTPNRSGPWSDIDVEAILKLYPKELQGSKQAACRSIRLALADLWKQGNEEPVAALKERVQNWFDHYQAKLTQQKTNKTLFVANPGEAQGWFNPKTRRRYMDDVALSPPSPGPDCARLNPIEELRRAKAQALAQKGAEHVQPAA